MLQVFRDAGENPFGHGYCIVDPHSAERVSRDAKAIRRRGLVRLCTLTDAWAPECQPHNLGRQCLAAILSEPDWSVRILAKNASVAQDFDLIAQHRDRVLVGLSITATPDQQHLISILEPCASPIDDRMQALASAGLAGLRTYAMLCPLVVETNARLLRTPGTARMRSSMLAGIWEISAKGPRVFF